MDISKQDMKFITEAIQESEKSDVRMRHGCILVKNGKIIGRGHNYKSGSVDEDIFTRHAEIDAIHNANIANKKHKISFKNVVLYVIRYKSKFLNSEPCYHCLLKIKELQIKRVIYSFDCETYKSYKPINHTTTFIT